MLDLKDNHEGKLNENDDYERNLKHLLPYFASEIFLRRTNFRKKKLERKP